jgi:predicted DNA-binding protein (MmcQ/YjbR family)
VYCNNEIADKLIFEMIDHSYNLVVSKLSKTDRLKFE